MIEDTVKCKLLEFDASSTKLMAILHPIGANFRHSNIALHQIYAFMA